MRIASRNTKTAAVLGLLVCVAVWGCKKEDKKPSGPPPKPVIQDEAGIRKAAEDWVTAVHSGDLAKVKGMLSADSVARAEASIAKGEGPSSLPGDKVSSWETWYSVYGRMMRANKPETLKPNIVFDLKTWPGAPEYKGAGGEYYVTLGDGGLAVALKKQGADYKVVWLRGQF